MPLTLDSFRSQNVIEAYSPGCVRIQEHDYTDSLLVSNATLQHWPVSTFDALQPHHLQSLLEHQPQLVLLGCGEKQRFLPPALLKPLANAGVGIEVMTNAALCRTFNILLAEEREVIAGLILEAN